MSWTRSLYWRIALGFVLGLAALLVVQALLLLWVASRSGPIIPGQPPARLAEAVAADLSDALQRDPSLDVAAYVDNQYGREAHPIFVVLSDGRTAANGRGDIPQGLREQGRVMLQRWSQGGTPPRFEGRGPRFRPPPGGELPSAGGGPSGSRGPAGRAFRPPRPAFIIVEGRPLGVVLVPPRASFGFLLRRYAPTLALVGVSVLFAGAMLAAVAIFGPARRRLRAVEEAARRLGAGDLGARAPVHGGDEVAAMASAFNAMADDLSVRAAALAASDRARRQLLADVSHELNTPVTAMRGYIETLMMPDFALDAATRARYLGIVADETARLDRIIGDLLDLARLEGGGGTFAVADVGVGQLFDRVRARHERTSAAAGVTIAAVVEPGAGIVRGDADRLEQALQNLAANALRAAPRGSTVELRARPRGDAVAISVSDGGPGIAPEHLPHIFDRFYKAESSRRSAGSGLGLSIVKAIVERHGGTVSVRSAPGRTEFELTLPHVVTSPAPAPAPDAP